MEPNPFEAPRHDADGKLGTLGRVIAALRRHSLALSVLAGLAMGAWLMMGVAYAVMCTKYVN